MTISPDLMFFVASATERTAGISSARAIMAEWEVRPPVSVTMPATFSLSMSAVIEGVSSSTTTMEFSGRDERSTTCLPRRSARRPVLTSATSAARSRKSSSSMLENMLKYMS